MQTFHDNGKLAYSKIDGKFFYRPEDVYAILTDVEGYKKDAIWRKRNFFPDFGDASSCFFRTLGIRKGLTVRDG